jgi:hypothetical protein
MTRNFGDLNKLIEWAREKSVSVTMYYCDVDDSMGVEVFSEKSAEDFYQKNIKSVDEFIKAWELTFRRDERIMRYLTLSLDRWAIEFNLKKRSGEIKSSSTAKEKKAANNAVVELDEED